MNIVNPVQAETDKRTYVNPQHSRGRPVHGVSIGIIMLNTQFGRVPGDIGYAGTFGFPVQYATLPSYRLGADLRPDEGTLKEFFAVVDQLVALGVDGIATSCGFFAIMQPYLTQHSPVPVAASALLQIPLVERTLPQGKRVGVLTGRKDALSADHFRGVGAPTDLPVVGLDPKRAFRRSMVEGTVMVDRAEHEREILEMAEQLLTENPNVGAIVLECTNMAPYSSAIERKLGVPVFDVVSLINWMHAGLRPRRFPIEG